MLRSMDFINTKSAAQWGNASAWVCSGRAPVRRQLQPLLLNRPLIPIWDLVLIYNSFPGQETFPVNLLAGESTLGALAEVETSIPLCNKVQVANSKLRKEVWKCSQQNVQKTLQSKKIYEDRQFEIFTLLIQWCVQVWPNTQCLPCAELLCLLCNLLRADSMFFVKILKQSVSVCQIIYSRISYDVCFCICIKYKCKV